MITVGHIDMLEFFLNKLKYMHTCIVFKPSQLAIFGPSKCSVRIVQKEVVGRNFSLGGGLRDEVGGRNFFRHGVEKEVGGRILSSILEERGK